MLEHDLSRKPVPTFRDHALHVLDDDAVHDIGDVVEAIDNLFEMIVDLVNRSFAFRDWDRSSE